MKGLKAATVVKEIKFEEVWGELKAKNGFQRLSAKFSFALYVFNNKFSEKIGKAVTK